MRRTFEGPLLVGDKRYGPIRNLGSANLVQFAGIDFTVGTNGAALYGGASTQFVASNGIPNLNANVYTPSASTYPSVVQAIPADTATNIYRGVVMYLPFGSVINDIFADIAVVPAVTSGTLTSTTIYVSNNYTVAAATPTYAATAVLTSPAVGRQSLATTTVTQFTNLSSTSADILIEDGTGTGPNAAKVSQLVFTVALVGTSLVTPVTGGRFFFTVRYTQLDGSIGTTSTYPYGNIA